MSADDQLVDVVVWTGRERAGLAQRVVERMAGAIHVVGAGGPDAAERDGLAKQLRCPSGDDFRKLLIDHHPAYVFVASCDGLREGDFAVAVGQGAVVLTVEPVASGLSEWATSRRRARALVGATATMDTATRESDVIELGRVIHVPAMVRSPGWLRATDPSEAVGRPRLIAMTSFGGREEWSLYGRLFDAWRSALAWGALPVTIDASLAGHGERVPEDIRDARGSMTAHGRLAEGCTVSVCASDASGGHTRRLEVVGEGGRLRVDDRGYSLVDARGRELDGFDPGVGAVPGLDELIAGQWRGLLDRRGGGDEGRRMVEECEVAACCLASLLSARTGDPERPGRLLELHGFA